MKRVLNIVKADPSEKALRNLKKEDSHYRQESIILKNLLGANN
jgi:hypothetical protein